jgi:pilus assembly protein CpaF
MDDHLYLDLSQYYKDGQGVSDDESDGFITEPEQSAALGKEAEEVLNKVKNHLKTEHLSLFQRSILDPQVTSKIGRIIADFIVEKRLTVPDRPQAMLIEDIKTELAGLGPLQPLINDDGINDILVNAYDEVYIETKGVLMKTGVRFRSEEHLRSIIMKIINPLGKTLNMTQPVVDARIGTSRVNAMLGQNSGGLALKGSNLSIRKFPARVFSEDELLAGEVMSKQMYDFLRDCVLAKANLLIVGGTGSGKTSTLKVLAGHIPATQRVITIEDAAEMNLHVMYPEKHFLPTETRKAEDDDRSYPIAKLIVNALRMRPDRIIVGEVRGPEAIEMLQAMNTGHEGSMTTIHANSAAESFERLVTMVKMSGLDYESDIIGTIVASAIDVILYQRRYQDGSRKITEVIEMTGYNGQPQFRRIFRFAPSGKEHGRVIGSFERTSGISDRLTHKFRENMVDPAPWKEAAPCS